MADLGLTQSRTEALIQWIALSAEESGGRIPEFTNEEAATAIGMPNLRNNGRAYGKLQSRVDLACYRCNLPPLGCAAEKPFPGAWRQVGQSWEFPIRQMQAAAQSRIWSAEDFEQIALQTRLLPLEVKSVWQDLMDTNDDAVRLWAFGLWHGSIIDDEKKKREPRAPRWQRDELILALDLYLKYQEEPLERNAPEVVELSRLLGKFGEMLGVARATTYRNTNGVYMKLMNFRRFDPQALEKGSSGLVNGSKDEEHVWTLFAHKPQELSEVADVIRQAILSEDADSLGSHEDDSMTEAEEGRVISRMHRTRERNSQLAQQKKDRELRMNKRLRCEACQFDFSVAYGPSAAHIIECHHTKPVHTLKAGDKTCLEDLVLLCANCHRVVHASKRWLTMDELTALVAAAASRTLGQGEQNRSQSEALVKI